LNRLQRKIAHRHSDLILWVRPRLDQMPLPMQRYDDPFLPFGKAIINTTRDLLCGYLFDFAAYLALGAAGAVALERTIAYVSDEAVSILHGPFASPDYTKAATAFGVDAVTITDAGIADGYLHEGVGVFALDIGDYDLKNLMLITDASVLRVLSNDVLYAGHGDDFAEQVRAAVESQIR
jgi:hypothetical protein